jgi:hypothetical protein
VSSERASRSLAVFRRAGRGITPPHADCTRFDRSSWCQMARRHGSSSASPWPGVLAAGTWLLLLIVSSVVRDSVAPARSHQMDQ